MTKNIIIAILVVVIILLLDALNPRGILGKLIESDPAPELKVHADSVIIAKIEIVGLLDREKILIAKGKTDSIARVKERIAYKKKIAHYEKRLSEINFEGTTALELDSIRNELYPPTESTVPDPPYSLPISQAQDLLQTKAGEPFRDSIQAANMAHIDSLERRVDSVAALCDDRLAVKDSIADQNLVIIRNLGAANEKLEKRDKRRRKWGWVKDTAAFVLGGLAGRGSKR